MSVLYNLQYTGETVQKETLIDLKDNSILVKIQL